MLGEYLPQEEGEQRHVDSTAVAKILRSLPSETGALEIKKKKNWKIHTSLRIGYAEPDAAKTRWTAKCGVRWKC